MHIPKYHSFVRGDATYWKLSAKDRRRVPENATWYYLDVEFTYYSKRYDKYVKLEVGMISDGATGAFDIDSASWWVHDKLCRKKVWANGTVCTRWQGSRVCGDILHSEDRKWRAQYWKFSTYLSWKVKHLF